MTLAVVGAIVGSTLLSSYSSRAASRAAEDTISQLEEQVQWAYDGSTEVCINFTTVVQKRYA